LNACLFIARLRAEFPNVHFTVQNKSGVPVLYAGKQRIDVELAEAEQLGLLLAAESSDDDVIETFYNIIRPRIIEQMRRKK